MGDSPLYSVLRTELQGNILVASRAIKAGDKIVHDEVPFVWQSVSVPGSCFHKFCDECGTVLAKELIEELAGFMELEDTVNREQLLPVLQELLPFNVKRCRYTNNSCNNNCGVMYCSDQCMNLGQSKGHSWLCESYQTVQNSTQQMHATDTKGHYGLAAKIYARIAAQCLERVLHDDSIDISEEAMRVGMEMLAEYHTEDFTRTMHVYRTGRMEIDQGMFDNIIFPAYFSSVLSTPLALCKEIFQQSGTVLWGVGALGVMRSEQFLSSPIFSEQFFSKIIGTFVVNCLSVHVPSPLNFMLSRASQSRSLTEPATTDSGEQGLLMEQAVNVLLHYRNRNQLSHQHLSEDRNSGNENKIFLGMSGSGLFPVFSKSNHSCLCNTIIHGSDKVSVSIVASEDIPQGAEITNCYIHHPTLNGGESVDYTATESTGVAVAVAPAGAAVVNDQHLLNRRMTKKQRYRAMRQYVFECNCPLCQSQMVESDEDSD